MTVICAFSSDSRELYKADIYRALSMPDEYILHFRYKLKYVDNNILTRKDKLKNSDVVIFFTQGNLLNSDKPPSLKHFSVRSSKLVHCEQSETTELFHVYLQLKSFCNYSIDSKNSEEKLPPTKFFTELDCTSINVPDTWSKRIEVLKEYYPEHIFYNLKGIYDYKKQIIPKYDNEYKSSSYNLNHGKIYILKVAFANHNNTNTKLNISDSSEDIIINCINPLESSVTYDDFNIPIFIKSLNVMNQSSILIFKLINESKFFGEYDNHILFNLKLSLWRPFIFGLLSAFAFIAVILSQAASKSWIILAFSIILVIISTGGLFSYFNKK